MKSHSSVLTKQATDCEIWLGMFWQIGWKTAQNICGSQALKTHCLRCLLGNIPKLSYLSEGWLLIIKQFGSHCLFFKPNPRVIQESWVPGEENKRPPRTLEDTRLSSGRASLRDVHPCSTSFKVGRWPFYSELTVPWDQQSELTATRLSIPFWSIENTVLHVWIQGNSLTISLRILMCRRQEK